MRGNLKWSWAKEEPYLTLLARTKSCRKWYKKFQSTIFITNSLKRWHNSRCDTSIYWYSIWVVSERLKNIWWHPIIKQEFWKRWIDTCDGSTFSLVCKRHQGRVQPSSHCLSTSFLTDSFNRGRCCIPWNCCTANQSRSTRNCFILRWRIHIQIHISRKVQNWTPNLVLGWRKWFASDDVVTVCFLSWLSCFLIFCNFFECAAKVAQCTSGKPRHAIPDFKQRWQPPVFEFLISPHLFPRALQVKQPTLLNLIFVILHLCLLSVVV